VIYHHPSLPISSLISKLLLAFKPSYLLGIKAFRQLQFADLAWFSLSLVIFKLALSFKNLSAAFAMDDNVASVQMLSAAD